MQATGTEDDRAATRGDEQAQRARNISVRHRSSSFVRDEDKADKRDAHNHLETSSHSVEMRDDSSPCAKATSGIRTLDLRFTKAQTHSDKPLKINDLQDINGSGATLSATRAQQNDLIDPDLQTVIAGWNSLPLPVRAGIVAMVRASNTEE